MQRGLVLILMLLPGLPALALANIPSPELSEVPASVLLAPDGSLGTTITVNGNQGPIIGASVLVRFSTLVDPLICWSPGQVHPNVQGTSDVNGQVTFFFGGGGCIDPARWGNAPVQIFADGVLIGEAGVASPDAVDEDGLLPSEIGFALDPLCGVSPVGVTLSDAAFHTAAITQAAIEPCSKLTPPFNEPVGVADAILITPFITEGSGGGPPPPEGSLDKAKIALHLTSHNLKGNCASAPATFACSDAGSSALVTSGSVGVGYDLYLVVLDIDPLAGLAGASLGLDYTGGAGGMTVISWQACGELEFPSAAWPDPGSGTVITYDSSGNCQTTVDPTDPEGEAVATLGFAYVYAYGTDVLSITPRSYAPQPDLKLADCSGAETSLLGLLPSRVGSVSFGTAGGYDPCQPVPTTFTLDVAIDGTGGGTVASIPPGIDCGSDCSEDYASGTLVDLVATPDPGSVFTGWSGACAGTEGCDLVMDSNRSVVATFDAVAACGTPDPAYSALPQAFVITPDGSFTSEVTVACIDGPLSGVTVTLTVDPTADGLIRWASGQNHPVLTGVTDANGVASFSIRGGLCSGVSQAVQVSAGAVSLGTAHLISPDAVTDLGQLPGDACFVACGNLQVDGRDAEYHASNLGSSNWCSDFNGNGVVDAADTAFVAGYLGATGTPESVWSACTPVADRTAALAILVDEVLTPSPYAGDLVAYAIRPGGTDSLLTAGTVVSPWDSTFLHTVDCPSYFFWMDNQPETEWTHPSTFAFVSSLTGEVTTMDAGSWPMVDGEELTPFLAETDGQMEQVFGGVASTPVVHPRVTTVSTGSDTACVIIAIGANLNGATEKRARENDVQRMLEYYNTNPNGPRVDKDHIRTLTGATPADTCGITVSQLLGALHAFTVAHPDCKKFYFHYIGHGDKDKSATRRAGLILWKDSTRKKTEVYDYARLAELFKDHLPGLTMCVTISACYSGAAVDDFRASGIQGTLNTSSARDRLTRRLPFNGGHFNIAINECSEDPGGDANGDGKVTVPEAIGWGLFLNPQLVTDCPQSVVLGGGLTLSFYKPKRGKTRTLKDASGTKFSYRVDEYCYGFISKGIPSDIEGRLCPWQPGRAVAADSIVCRKFLFIKNPNSNSRRLQNPVEVVCVARDGSETVLRKLYPPQLDLSGYQETRIMEIPVTCEEIKFNNVSRKAGIMPLAAVVNDIDGSDEGVVLARGATLFQILDAGGAPGDVFATQVEGIPGWGAYASPAAFTTSALIDTEFVALEGAVPDTATAGGVLHLTVVNTTQMDTLSLAVTVLVEDSLATTLGGGDTHRYLAMDAYGGLTVLSDTLRLTGCEVDFRASTAALVDSLGSLCPSYSLFRATGGATYSMTVRGDLAWDSSVLQDPQNGLKLDGASGYVRGGAVLNSQGSGLTLRGDLSGLELTGVLVDSSGADGLVVDGVSGLVLDGLIVENSVLADVRLAGPSTAHLRDCIFDRNKVQLDPPAALTRSWTTHLRFSTHQDDPIGGVDVEIRDAMGALVAAAFSSPEGFVENLDLIEFAQFGSTRIMHSPYTVSASWSGVDTTVVHQALEGGVFSIVLTDSSTTGLGTGNPRGDQLSVLASPNPFLSSTRISFELGAPARSRVQIFDISGRQVATVLEGLLPAGPQAFEWTPKGLPAGIYFYQVRAGSARVSGKLVLSR